MTKKINFKEIKTTIPSNITISKINDLNINSKRITLNVNVISKKYYEVDNSIIVILDIEDSTGKMKAILGGNRNNSFITFIESITVGLKYKICGNVYLYDDELNDIELPFINEIKENKMFFVYALQQ
jgi:hypothetical protein